MPGFFVLSSGVSVDRVAGDAHVAAAASRIDPHFVLDRRDDAHAADAADGREALVERIETAVFRGAAILRTVARAERIGFRLRRDLRGGDESETESSGQGEKAHDHLLCRPGPDGVQERDWAWRLGGRGLHELVAPLWREVHREGCK